jgi:hypothetical protein
MTVNEIDYLVKCIRDDRLERMILNNEINFDMCNNFCIKWASKNGKIDLVEKLLKDDNVDPTTDYNFAINIANHYGQMDIVNLLNK